MQDEVKKILREEMDLRHWFNDDWRAGLAAIIGGESHFLPKFETGYSRTSNDRIRRIFPSRVRGMSDEQIDEIKRTDRSWFNFVYGGRYGNRPGTDDGFDFRGGGLNQLTFRDNYDRYGNLAGVDLIHHPELVNAPRVAAAVAVEYMKDRFHGGDFAAQKAAVGVSIGEPDEEKNRLYEEYTETGEWNYRKVPAPDAGEGGDVGDPVVFDPIVTRFLADLHDIENFFRNRKLYSGPIDDDPGPGLRAALKAYIRQARS